VGSWFGADLHLDISAAALLAGQGRFRSLSVAEIDMARTTTAPSTTPLTEYLKVWRRSLFWR
jgi:hypothetical protein